MADPTWLGDSDFADLASLEGKADGERRYVRDRDCAAVWQAETKTWELAELPKEDRW